MRNVATVSHRSRRCCRRFRPRNGRMLDAALDVPDAAAGITTTPSWTMRLPERSSGSASPRFSRQRRTSGRRSATASSQNACVENPQYRFEHTPRALRTRPACPRQSRPGSPRLVADVGGDGADSQRSGASRSSSPAMPTQRVGIGLRPGRPSAIFSSGK
jgi:hypothetical protein